MVGIQVLSGVQTQQRVWSGEQRRAIGRQDAMNPLK
jgi:hypothetical protein